MTLLLGYAIKSSLVLLAALAGVRLLGGRSAAFRHALLATAVIAAGAVPLLTALLPARTISLPAPMPVLSTVPAAATPAVEKSAEQYYEVDAFPPSATATVQTREVEKPRSLNPAQLFFWLWVAGVAALLANLMTGVVQLIRLSRRSRILDDGPWVQLAAETARRYGLSARLRVLESCGQTVLATWGVFRPQLLLPAGASTWPEERIRVVLHHELAHVCRYDWLIQMSAEIFRAVYWFNPLSWIACEALVQESEQACDDIALNCGITGPDYAQQLLALTVALQHPAPDVSAAMSMARPSTLERRFTALLNPRENRSAMTRVSMLLVMAIVLALAGPVASLRLVAETMTMILPAPLVAAIPVPALESAPVLQGPPPPPVPIPSGASSIEGTVVKFGTGEPIAAADVSLQMLQGPGAAPMGPPAVIQTGADGKFAFRNLAAGNYRLVALRAEGFVVAEYGQRTPNGRGRPLLVAEGQSVSAVNLAMLPTGSISGRILDRDGEPLARAQVQALQLMYRDGRKVVKIIQSVQTNDVGEYRLFWLPPDAYYISARPEDIRRRAVPLYVNLPGTGGFFEQAASPVVTHRALDSGGTAEESFVLVYYPGTIDFTTASRVDLRAGDSLGGVNFSVGAGQVRSRHLKGRAIDVNGQPLSGTVSAIPRTPHPNVTIPSATLDANGHFDIAGVAPGSYYVVAGSPLGIAAVEVSGSD
ncbi:MAG TPA: M56 family metallopeptidase, partial [Terriglobia bacterium]|nr:M56 family metallopeptidase [Terriglobia bacterium]